MVDITIDLNYSNAYYYNWFKVYDSSLGLFFRLRRKFLTNKRGIFRLTTKWSW